MKSVFVFVVSCALAASAFAKLPAPSDEAKAKAAEAAAKTAHTGKVDSYLLCKSQDKVANRYRKTAGTAHKDAKAPAAAPCADPGPFVYKPADAAPAAAPAAAAATVPDAKKKTKS